MLVIAQRMFTGIDQFPLMAIPFFILAGEMMNTGGDHPGIASLFRRPRRPYPGRTGPRQHRG